LINKVHDTHTYEVVCAPGQDKLQEIEKLFRESGLHVRRNKRIKSESGTISIWYAQGKPEKHDQLVETLIAHPDVKEFRE
jgi:endonuclease III